LSFLGALKLNGPQQEVVERGLKQLPLSTELHNWLRWVILRDQGARALEAAYEGKLFTAVPEKDRAAIDWFRGLASLVAAERDVSSRDPETAAETYQRSREHFERSIAQHPEFTPSAAHYRCLALAAEARLLTEAERWDEAVETLVAAYRMAPNSIGSKDGLGKSPKDSAAELRRDLIRADRADLALDLDTLLEEVLPRGWSHDLDSAAPQTGQPPGEDGGG
jgi:tetratricopeptide (TPR) repeat protein